MESPKYKVGDKVIYIGNDGITVKYGEVLTVKHLSQYNDKHKCYGVGKAVVVYEHNLRPLTPLEKLL